MTRRRHTPAALPASAAAVALIAQNAQRTTGRPMPEAEMCELLTQAREIEFQRFLDHSGVPRIGPAWHHTPPIGSVHYSPAAYAALRGLTGTAADMFTEIATAIQNTKT